MPEYGCIGLYFCTDTPTYVHPFLSLWAAELPYETGAGSRGRGACRYRRGSIPPAPSAIDQQPRVFLSLFFFSEGSCVQLRGIFTPRPPKGDVGSRGV